MLLFLADGDLLALLIGDGLPRFVGDFLIGLYGSLSLDTAACSAV